MFDAEDVTAEEKEKHELSRKIIDMAKDRNRFEMQVEIGPDPISCTQESKPNIKPTPVPSRMVIKFPTQVWMPTERSISRSARRPSPRGMRTRSKSKPSRSITGDNSCSPRPRSAPALHPTTRPPSSRTCGWTTRGPRPSTSRERKIRRRGKKKRITSTSSMTRSDRNKITACSR